jgi:hypothetical protein
MTKRFDLPPEKAANFSQRVRETLMTYLGKQGDPLDRGLTLRDLIRIGILSIKPGNSLQPGQEIPPIEPGPVTGREPDLTPPPTPSGFAVSAAITNVFIEHDEPLYRQGGGHFRTRVYGATRTQGQPAPTFDQAVEIAQFFGTVYAYPTTPATTWHLWIKWETRDGVLSADPAGGTNGLDVRTGEDVDLLLQALTGQITEDQLYSDLGNRIDLVDGPTSLQGSVAQRILTESQARAAADQSLGSSITTLQNTTSTQATQISQLGTRTTTAESNITNLQTTTTNQATQISQLSTTVSGNTAAIQQEATTRASADNTLFAQYTVKVDVAGLVSGFGLASTANNATPTSQFGVRANQFYVAPPSLSSSTDPSLLWGTRSANAAIFSGYFLVAGDAGLTAVSQDGLNWTSSNALALTTWGASAAARAISRGAEVFLVAGDSGHVATSADGLTWIYQGALRATSWGTSAACLAVARSPEQFLAVGQSGRAAISSDGITWSYQSALSATTWGTSAANAALWALDQFIVAGASGHVATSPDGLEWTHQPGLRGTTWGTSAAVNALAWSGSVLLAVGAGGRVATSSDTQEWIYHETLIATEWGSGNVNAAIWDGVQFVILGDGGRVATSPDGQEWTYQGQLAQTTWGSNAGRALVFGLGRTLAAGANGASASSADAQTWEPGFLSTSSNLYEGYVWRDTSVTPAVTRYRSGSTWASSPSNLPFVIQATPTTLNGTLVPPGVYMDAAYIRNGTITNAKIGNAAIDDAKIANLSASKIIAGSIAVGEHIQSAGYIPGSEGWRIGGNGVAEFSNAVVRGTVFASAGEIGGNSLGSTFIQSSNYSAGSAGWRLQSDGALEANTGTFRGSIVGGNVMGGDFTSYNWPPSGGTGFYLGPEGLRLGNTSGNSGRFFQVTSAGNISAPGFSVTNGTLTINEANVIDTLQVAGNAITFPNGSNSNGSFQAVSVTLKATGKIICIVSANILAISGNTSQATVSLRARIDGQDGPEVGVSLASGFSGSVTAIHIRERGSGSYACTGVVSISGGQRNIGACGVVAIGAAR